jgi:outer membrane lipoprotein carrier protein
MRRITAAFLFCFSIAAPAWGGLEALDKFVRETSAARADFSQVVFDEAGERVSEAEGVLWFARPDKFRLEYKSPYRQMIVADGETVWFFDAGLNQVSIRPYSEIRGESAVEILAGGDIAASFVLAAAPPTGELSWVNAVPKNRDGTFRVVRLGFAATDDSLRVMVLEDNFENTTRLRFGAFNNNDNSDGGGAIEDSLFTFTPPPDAEIVGEE